MAPASCHYRLDFAGAAQHLIDVQATFASTSPSGAEATPTLTLALPVWTPGSYMVREYARHLEGVRAFCQRGRPLPLRKVAKDRWEVQTQDATLVAVHYRVYAHELSVRTNYVDADLAIVQGAATFLRPVADAGAGAGTGAAIDDATPFEVEVHLPHGWPQVVTGLAGEQEGRVARFFAPDYDALLDAPLLLGNVRQRQFDVAGVRHTLATLGGDGLFDDAPAAGELAAIVRQARALFGELPYDSYVFMNVLLGGGGGLEHRNSALCMAAPTVQRSLSARADWHGLMAHELLHAWNIKRLRPQALGPFDYAQENYTPSLWVAEGLTAYYDDLLVRRAGLVDDATYFQRLAATLSALRKTPGQRGQSLTEASHDAWIKLYRRDENTDNTTVSYYLKGSLVGWCIDARLRQATCGQKSLDDVMRLAYGRYSGTCGYSEADFRACINEVAGADWGAWLAGLLDDATPMVVDAALDAFGLQLHWAAAGAAAADKTQGSASSPLQRALWGVRLDGSGPRLLVGQVRRDAPAYDAGLNVGDELLAVGDWRLPAGEAALRAIAEHAADDGEAYLLVARLGRLRRLKVTLTQAPKEQAQLTVHPDADAAQAAMREAWLGGQG